MTTLAIAISTVSSLLAPSTDIETLNRECERRRSDLEESIAALDAIDPDDTKKWAAADTEVRRRRAAFERAEKNLEAAIARAREDERQRKAARHAELHKELTSAEGLYAKTIRRYADRMKAAAELLQENERELDADTLRMLEQRRELSRLNEELGLEPIAESRYPRIVDNDVLLAARRAAFGPPAVHTYGRWLHVQLHGVEVQRPGGTS